MERWIHNARMFSARGGLITSVMRVPQKHFQLLSSNTTMDTQTLADAAAYARIKAANLAYYHAHAAEIAAKRKEMWKLAHPNPRPRGRPRKATGGGGVAETESGSSSSSESV
jgi:hypothetical protein